MCVFELNPFQLNKIEKQQFLNDTLSKLTLYHYDNCAQYRNMLDAYGYSPESGGDYYKIPFLPSKEEYIIG